MDDIPLPDTQILQMDQIFLLEKPVPVATRDIKTAQALSKDVESVGVKSVLRKQSLSLWSYVMSASLIFISSTLG